jgi:hypothetical protein
LRDLFVGGAGGGEGEKDVVERHLAAIEIDGIDTGGA